MMGLSDEKPPTWRMGVTCALLDAGSLSLFYVGPHLPGSLAYAWPLGLLPGIAVTTFTFCSWMAWGHARSVPEVEAAKAQVVVEGVRKRAAARV